MPEDLKAKRAGVILDTPAKLELFLAEFKQPEFRARVLERIRPYLKFEYQEQPQ